VRKCTDCGTELEVGVNWSPSRARNRTYRCNKCHKDKYGAPRSYYHAYDMTYKRTHPGYQSNHHKVRVLRGVAREYLCAGCCGGQAAEWAHVHDTDPADAKNYVPLCKRCHTDYDR